MGVNGNTMATEARKYFDEVDTCARYYVTEWASKTCSEGGLNLLQPLCDIPPLKISDNSSSELTTFGETWDAANCANTLRSTSLYEAPGSIWWATRKKEKIKVQTEEHIVLQATYAHFEAGRSFWTDVAFNSSNSDPNKRRFIFPGFLPTCIEGSIGVEES